MEEKTRTATVDMLKGELGHSVETDILLDRLWDLWEVMDMLREVFGAERAQALINASTFLPSPISEVMVV